MTRLPSILKGLFFLGLLGVLVFCQALPRAVSQEPGAGEPQPTAPNPEPKVDWKHRIDPDIELLPDQGSWPEALQDLWAKALLHPESDLRREAADTVSLAYSHGMSIEKPIIEALLVVVKDPEEKPLTVTAAAAALANIDAKEAADTLAQQISTSPQTLQLQLDRAFARWDYQPMRATWLARLETPDHQRILVESAVVCLGEVREPLAAPILLPWLLSSKTSPSLRLKVARCLARLPIDDRLGVVATLLEDNSKQPALTQLLAATLLAEEDSPETVELLDSITRMDEPTAIGEALRRLLSIAPEKIVQQADRLLEHRDGNIRHVTVDALATAPSEESIVRLTRMIGDPVPAVRQLARKHLLVMAANEELRPIVVTESEKVIATDDWRGLEQSILILTELNQTQIGQRLLDLVDHPRSEVYNTACWGLRRLKIVPLSDAVHQRFIGLFEELQEPSVSVRYYALGHLAEALAELDHKPAVPDLVKLIPKEVPIHPTTRSAGIWALGYLLAGTGDRNVATPLEGRLADAASIPPESNEVRAMAAVSLGRIGSQESLAPLRHWAATEGAENYIGRRCYWSVRELTGEPIPDIQPRIRQLGDWFLQAVTD